MDGSDSEAERAKGEKEKHSLSVFRSQGASRKMKYLMQYCKQSGYMVLLVLKPTWPRGKPRAMKSSNFTGPILVPKNGEEGTGIKQLKALDLAESSNEEEMDQGGDVRGSPRCSRPLGKAHKKKKGTKKEEIIRCHACGEAYNEKISREDNILWVFCGGEGPRGKGCSSFAAHATCWNISGGKKDVKKLSKFYIRCKDCQAIEDESSDDENDRAPPSRSREQVKRKKSSAATSSQPGASNAHNHQNSREDDEDSPSSEQQSSRGKSQQSASSQPDTSNNHQKSRGLHKSNSQSSSRTGPPRHPPSEDEFK